MLLVRSELTAPNGGRYGRAVDRFRTAIYSFTFTAPIGLALMWLVTVKPLAGWAAISLAVTAALIVKPD
jgi:hypothetical protein